VQKGRTVKKWLLSTLGPALKKFGLHLYEYKKSDCTATTVVLFNGGTRALVVTRKKDPFKGKRSFAGGFLDVGDETLRQAARRELREEASLDFPEEQFVPVDERSDPDRDPRGHIVDHGFVVDVPEARTDEVIAAIKANDDAEAAEVVPVATLLAEGMAFDHVKLLRRSLAKAGYTQAI
jgi:8-oxo-dGTP diphosphatase